ncbi:transcriptional regulator [Salinisphaera sp. S4-8]|uniref:PadR family transcriptional regulator n=1 Tax=Salinisphaera sp. S4-8 TaxID=633357 RepID=UPI0033400FA1
MSLRYALLAAIDETPSTGYALTRRFNEGLAHVWSANHQQVYRELARLEKEGLLSVTVESQAGKPDRKRYAITAAGIEALGAWVEQIAARPATRDPLLVKLFAGDLVSSPRLCAELDTHRQTWREQLATYRAIEARYFADPDTLSHRYRLQYLALRRGILNTESWLAWADEVQAVLA